MASVQCGLDCLARDDFALLRGKRIGLVSHPAAVARTVQSCVDVLRGAPLHLGALFGPEHGFLGQEQDLIAVHGERETVVCHSLYGESFESLKPTREQLRGLDALVIDLQDVGSRYYTYQATMLLCLEAASEIGLPVIVLDRPNPLGGEVVEGPTLRRGFESFVGLHPIPIRHGMTIGELARLYQTERNLAAPLHVVPCEGWRRSMLFDQAALPWVLPSPNMPTLKTALVYPGQCLLEGTNLSEGRGTTRPFEICGAPWIEPRRLVERLAESHLPGVAFRPVWFRPTFHKFSGQACGGVQVHVTDRGAFQPVRTGLHVLAAMRELSGDHFKWRRETYEFVSDRLAIDLLFGSERERLALEASAPPGAIAAKWGEEEEAFRRRRQAYLLYS